MGYTTPTATEADVVASWSQETHTARQLARGIPEALVHIDLGDIEPRTPEQATVKDALLSLGKRGLYIHGGVGTGKTCMVTAWAVGTIRGTMAGAHLMPWKDVVDDQRDKMNSRDDPSVGKMLWRAMSCARLAIDDMGAGKVNAWEVELMERLLDARWRAQLQTVITSNLTPKEIDAKFGDRITTRIRGLCRSVELQGPDQRRAK